MAHVSAAAIRRAAQALRAKAVPVSVPALAKELDIEPEVARHYAFGLSDVAHDIGLEDQKSDDGPYCKAGDRLRVAGLRVTAARLAILSGSSAKAVKMWLCRHPEKANSWPLYGVQEHRDELLITRIRWLRRHLGPDVTILELCVWLGLDRGTLYRRMHKNPRISVCTGLRIHAVVRELEPA